MEPMIDAMVNDLLACVVMLDGVAYVPVMAAIHVFAPLFLAGGGLVASFIFVIIELLSLLRLIGSLMCDWLRKRFARKPPAE